MPPTTTTAAAPSAAASRPAPQKRPTLIHWAQESCDRRDDPVSGARIIQLTSAASISNNIYCEQPYCSADGKRLVILRRTDFCFGATSQLLVHELPTLRIAMVDRDFAGGGCNNAWSGLFYYWRSNGELVRLDMTTLEQEVLFVEENPARRNVGSSVSPDQRHMIYSRSRLEGEGAPVVQIVQLDLQTQKHEVIFEHPEITNPHLQYNPITGKQILVQHNRGSKLEKDGTVSTRVGAQGTTLFVLDADGSNKRDLPVGPPITAGATGHECFIGDTGRVLFSVAWNHNPWRLDERFPTGNLFTAAPGDAKPTVFECPEHKFNHVCASRCGRYFVADSHAGNGLFVGGEIRPVSLVIGCFRTGKYRVLVEDTLASGGGNQCTHSHPYLTADNGHVIFNADPYYSPAQVFAARVPEGFLESLA